MLGDFTWVDWVVVAGFLALTTWVGERAAGRQGTIRDFFLGGRTLPWFAVSASIVATEISAVTFVSLPYVVYADGGNLTYLQLGVFGSLIARLVVARYLVPAYYEREIFSPYDYMGHRLGGRVRGTTTALFALGGVLAQSCRVYLTAVVLELVLHHELARLEAATGVSSLAWSVLAIGLVAVGWTWIGGMATVIWTDAILFGVFVLGLLAALVVAVGHVDGGLSAALAAGADAGKLRFLDLDPDPSKTFTLWTALFAATWMMTGAYGTDQLMAQRMFCCRGPREAQKAILGSYVGVLVTALAALVGIALFAYYREHPLEGTALALYEEKGDRIFPLFVLGVLPTGLKGLIVAGIFAAAISSLDSILAALSQTVLSATWLPRRRRALGLGEDEALPPDEERRGVRLSRRLVLAFGVLLCVAAVGVQYVAERYPSILDLALAMATYTWGALLAGFLLAFLPLRVDGSGYPWAAALSVFTVFAIVWSGHAWAVLATEAFVVAVLGLWVVVRLRGEGLRPEARGAALRRTWALAAGLGLVWGLVHAELELAWPWNVPIGCLVGVVFGVALARPRPTVAP